MSARKKQRLAGASANTNGREVALPSSAEDHPYRKGSIVRIKMHHFLTYKDIECQPGSRLNMILGPNGSGKSSIACAINIVCAGDFKNSLQRPKSLMDFIKKGEKEAWVEAEFYQAGKDGRNVTVRRSWDRRGTDSWIQDEKRVGADKIRELMVRLNIQVDNLCVFLAQERVANFSQMKPVMLLEEVQKAVSPELYERHQTLCRDNKRQGSMKAKLDENRLHLRQLQANHQQLEEVVALEKERQRLVDQEEALRIGRAWAVFYQAKEEFDQLTQARKDMQRRRDAKLSELTPLKRRLQKAQRRQEAAQEQCRADAEQYDKAKKTAGTLLNSMEKLGEKIQASQQELVDLEDAREQHATRLKQRQAQLERLREQLARLPDSEELQAQQRETQREIKKAREVLAEHIANQEELVSEHKRIQRQLAELQAQLRNLQDRKSQRFEQACRKDPKIRQAYDAVQQLTRGQALEKPVFGPLFMHIDPESEKVAQYLESAVGHSFRMAYACQTKNDWKRLRREFESRRLPFRVIEAQALAPHQAHRGCDERMILQHGGRFLDSAIQAPDVVLWALQSATQLHRIVFVDLPANADEQFKERARDQLMVGSGGRNPQGTRTLFLGDEQFRSNVSRYGDRTVTTSITRVPRPEIFGGAVDPSLTEALQERIRALEAQVPNQDRVRAEEQARQEASTELEELQARSRELRAQMDQGTKLRRQGTQCETELQRLQADDHESKLRQARARLGKLRGKGSEAAAAATRFAQEVQDKLALLCTSRMSQVHLECVADALSEALKQAKEGLAQFDEDLRQAQRAANVALANARDLKSEARELGSKTEFQNRVAAGGDTWGHLGELQKVEQFDSAMRSVRTHLGSMRQDSAKLKEYEQSKARLERYELETQTLETEFAQLELKINSDRTVWLSRLEEVNKSLSEKFSSYYKEVSCQGEVRIGKAETFDKWGLEVWVSYRKDEPLCRLSTKQSGGERSVATMLFLLSLQAVTDCPFRVVDEINQAMDPRNERMVFQQIVHSTTTGSTPQYFLISPSLLPNLDYDPKSNICILNVLCGVWLKVTDPICMIGHNARRLLARRRAAAAAGQRQQEDERQQIELDD